MSDQNERGIWAPYEAFYIEAMLFSTKSAAKSVTVLTECLAQIERWPDDPSLRERDTDAILDNFQNIAIQGAALSRYLWPSKDRGLHRLRARHLRRALGAKRDSPVRNRDLRNQMEHFDERLDLYLDSGIVGNIFPSYIGPFSGNQQVPTHLFRAYYFDTGVFEVLGHRYAMQPIADEIGRIHDALVECTLSGFRLPKSTTPTSGRATTRCC